MLDEREAPVAAHELHRAFNRQSVWRRIAVVAGPLANFVLAIALYWGLYPAASKSCARGLAAPEAATPAAHAGFRGANSGALDQWRAVETWQEFRWKLLNLALDKQVVTVETVNASRRSAFASWIWPASCDQAERDVTGPLGLQLQRPPACRPCWVV